VPNICILGLGNPGQKYNGTRHNIGKDWVTKYCLDSQIDLAIKNKLDTSLASSIDEKIIWGFPNLYVNESGQSVKKVIKSNSLGLPDIIVIHDDLDLPVGTLRLKVEGGHGGHNGLRSIISLVGNDFFRLRVGIGHPGDKEDVTNWVLGKFKPQEKKLLADSYIEFLNIIDLLADREIKKVQLKLHTE
jgi:PTH1 family peptidyl-tRNA hydrolase